MGKPIWQYDEDECSTRNFDRVLVATAEITGQAPNPACARAVFDKICDQCEDNLQCYFKLGREVGPETPQCQPRRLRRLQRKRKHKRKRQPRQPKPEPIPPQPQPEPYPRTEYGFPIIKNDSECERWCRKGRNPDDMGGVHCWYICMDRIHEIL